MNDPTGMPCNELVEVITEYLEGTLPAPDRVRFELHLTFCPACRDYLEQMRATVSALGKLSEESIPEDARPILLQAFRTWKKKRPSL